MRFPARLLPLVLLLLLGAAAGAEVLSGALTGGQAQIDGGSFIELTDPIGTIGNNSFEDDNVRAFDEVQDLTLSENLILDAVDPSLSSNVLGPGSVVSSHYLIFDPASTKDAIGDVSFDEPILGIIRRNARFNDTDDILGNATATYSIGDQGLEQADLVSFSGSNLDFDFTSNSPGDALRIVTGVDPVPGINVCGPEDQTLSGVTTGGSATTAGGVFKQICEPIGDVGDDNFEAPDLFAFEEQQAVELDEDLFLDNTNFIAAGNFVSSFYVVFDPSPTQTMIGTITFPDTIIGVIEDKDKLIDSDFLGDASASYLSPNLRGLEAGDTVSISGADLDIDFTASTPGDSVRVILGSASPSLSFNVCDPGDVTLSGAVTGGAAFTAGGVFTQLCTPIGPVGNDNHQSNDLIAFEEDRFRILDQPIAVDHPNSFQIQTGSAISSYYVFFDPSSSKDNIGEVTFPRRIIGVATQVDTLTDSDSLGHPTATYLNPGLRGLEGGVDSLSISENTLSVDFSASSPGDYVRVFTAAAPPVPGSGPFGRVVLACALAAAAAAVWRLRGARAA